jgi:hypothetical protein
MLNGDSKLIPRTIQFLVQVVGYAGLIFVIWQALKSASPAP